MKVTAVSQLGSSYRTCAAVRAVINAVRAVINAVRAVITAVRAVITAC